MLAFLGGGGREAGTPHSAAGDIREDLQTLPRHTVDMCMTPPPTILSAHQLDQAATTGAMFPF